MKSLEEIDFMRKAAPGPLYATCTLLKLGKRLVVTSVAIKDAEDDLIAAARSLAAREPGWRFVLVGGGRDEAALREAAAEVSKALEFKGYEHKMVWGEDGHSGRHGGSIFPESAKWVFRAAKVKPVKKATPKTPIYKYTEDSVRQKDVPMRPK